MNIKTNKENVKSPRSRVKKLIANYIVTHKDIMGKEKKNSYLKLREARDAGIILYRLGRFIKLENKKGVVLPL